MVHRNKEGAIYSPYFMNKLLDRDQVYEYRIEAGAGMKIYLAFSYINFGSDTTCSNTKLSIYEGKNTNGIPNEIRCGRNATQYLSTTNTLTLKYVSTIESSTLPADHGFIIYFASGHHGKSLNVTKTSDLVIEVRVKMCWDNDFIGK